MLCWDMFLWLVVFSPKGFHNERVIDFINNSFLHLLKKSCTFYPLVYVIDYVIDLCMLSCSCISGMRLTWYGEWSFRCLLEFSLQIFYWELLKPYATTKLACDFCFLCPCLVLVTQQLILASSNELAVFLPFLFLCWFLKSLVNLNHGPIWAWAHPSLETLYYCFIFITNLFKSFMYTHLSRGWIDDLEEQVLSSNP